jgi:hypothetical protein
MNNTLRDAAILRAIGSPASVANACNAGEWLAGSLLSGFLSFPDCASHRKEAVFEVWRYLRNRILDIQAASAHPESEQRPAFDLRHRRFHTSSSPIHLPQAP